MQNRALPEMSFEQDVSMTRMISITLVAFSNILLDLHPEIEGRNLLAS